MPAPEAVQRGGFEQVGVREAVLLTFGVDAPSEVVLAQDGSGSVLEEKRDRRLPGGRVAAEHDDHDAKVEARADLEWASCMRLVLAGVKGSHAQTGMQHFRAFVQSSLHLDNSTIRTRPGPRRPSTTGSWAAHPPWIRPAP